MLISFRIDHGRYATAPKSDPSQGGGASSDRESAEVCSLLSSATRNGSEEGPDAHLDRRRSNSIPDNLAFLCLEHHSDYDSTTSQHKNYTIAEVKAARTALYAWITKRMPSASARPPRDANKRKSTMAPRTSKSYPRVFHPILSYNNIDGEGHFPFAGETYTLQLMNVRNSQDAVETTANSVVARLEYRHASGDTFVAQRALWLTAGKAGSELVDAVSLGPQVVGRMASLAITGDGDLFALIGGQARKVQLGQWTIQVSITADNCQPLSGQIGFTWFPGKGFSYTSPAFRHD